MKKIMLSIVTIASALSTLQAQGTWTPRAPLPPGDTAFFQGIPGFSIGYYGYTGLGDYTGAEPNFDDFYQFDPSSNTWTKKASFPGKARVAPACFVICQKAYLVCGSVTSGGKCVNECWEYNADSNKWTQKADFPGGARTYAVGFAIDSVGYVGTGADELSDFYKDFYAYHPSTNTWTQIADFGGIARDGDCGFAVNGKGYVCFGQDSSIKNQNDIWEYDPGLNTWTQKTNCPGPGLLGESGFTICDNIYVGSGDSTSALLANDHKFWKYNTLSDTWLQVIKVPGLSLSYGAAFSVGDSGYYGFGIDSAGPVQNRFYKFYAGDTCDNIISCSIFTPVQNINKNISIDVYPNPTNKLLNVNFSGQTEGLATLSIMDITGREVFQQQEALKNLTLSIDVSFLAPGMYFINIKNKDGSLTQKFIKL